MIDGVIVTIGAWLAAFWTLLFVVPLGAVCLWLATLLVVVLVLRRLA